MRCLRISNNVYTFLKISGWIFSLFYFFTNWSCDFLHHMKSMKFWLSKFLNHIKNIFQWDFTEISWLNNTIKMQNFASYFSFYFFDLKLQSFHIRFLAMYFFLNSNHYWLELLYQINAWTCMSVHSSLW